MVQRMILEPRRGRAGMSSSPMLSRSMFSRSTSVWVRAALAAACLIGLLAFSLSRAGAQDGQARQACSADFRRLCAGTSPGGGRIRKCLNDNFDALSDACKQAIGARTGK
jgi:hypothetical protein